MSIVTTVPESHRQILETATFAYASTIRKKDQFISTNPVGFDWDGETFRFSTLKSRVKYRNMQADPRLTVCMVGCGSVAETTICLSEEYCLIVSLILLLSFISSLHCRLGKGIVLGLCLNSIKHNWDMVLD